MKLRNAIVAFGDKFAYPIAVVDVNLPDQPLIYINPSFIQQLLYTEDQILGQNCRFLQGPKTDPQALSRIRIAISTKAPICQDLVNYKQNGEEFFNRLVLIPFKEREKQFYIGLQHIITEDQFKPINDKDASELMDRTINPLTVLLGFFVYPPENVEEEIARAIMRIREYVLSL